MYPVFPFEDVPLVGVYVICISFEDVPLVEFMYHVYTLRMYLWWSLRTLYFLLRMYVWLEFM